MRKANLNRFDIPGNRDCSSGRELLAAMVKRYWQKLGYCSVFATVPAMLIPHIQAVRAGEAKIPEANVTGRGARFLERPNNARRNPALLKRQARFRLPHQQGNFAMLPALAGNEDDCPGRAIPGGNYTAAAPYVGSGDTTGANDTVTTITGYYYYYNYNANGPDHVYTFVLTARGPNPQIEVSTTSGTYKPLIYVLDGSNSGSCPAGTGNTASNWWTYYETRWTSGNTAKLDIDFLPLNVPLHLFVDSAANDASGAGPYTIRMQDVTVAPAAACANPNPIDCVEFFVRQQYLDFFGREPDSTGFQTWVNTLLNCPNGGFGEFDSPLCDRVHVSAGFYQSHEFQERGYWLLRFSEASLDRRPTYAEFVPDLQQIGGSKTPAEEDTAKIVYTNAFIQRQEFQNRYAAVSNSQYVNMLEQNAGVTLSNKQALIDALNAGTNTRAGVLRSVVESQVVFDKFIIPGFVTMEYFGYLHRDPDTIGYQNWVDTLTANPNDYRHMIFGFIYSTEYRARFGPQ
jgi:hypothetical protein